MKKTLLVLMAMFALGLQHVNAQENPMKIVTNHPDFDVKVKRCATSGKSLILDMVFINKGTQDVIIDVIAGNWRYWTEIYDDEGNTYKGNKNSTVKVKVANSKAYEGAVSGYRLIPGVPAKVSFSVNNFSETAESIAYFEGVVICDAWGLPDKDKWLIIRNIPITRD